MSRGRAPWAVLGLASVLVGIQGCGSDDGGDAASGPPSGPPRGAATNKILFLSLDTLRADHLSLYGYERPTSPAIEAFAGRSTLYTRALATAPWTLPSHASMFTGLYPVEHGAHTWPLVDEDVEREAGNNVGSLAERFTTLAEVLEDAGYATGAVVANLAYMDECFGMAQGFQHYDQKRGAVKAVSARALDWLSEHQDGPFFLFVNFMDTHRPYNSRPRPGFGDPTADKNALKRAAPYILDPERTVPPELLATVIEQYDTAIANLDEGLGELFDELRARGLFDDMLIVVTSDHGEYLGEKDLIEHSKDVHQPVLHVPLIVKVPGQTVGAVDEEWISHVHLPALVLAYVDLGEGVETPTEFLAHWPRGRVFSENYYSRIKDLRARWGARFDRVRRVIVEGDLKFIDSSDGAHELYDLGRDPGEDTNLWPPDGGAGERLAVEAGRWWDSRAVAPQPAALELSGELQRTMEEMGYAGSDDDEDGTDDR